MKTLTTILVAFSFQVCVAQVDLYLVFEFMNVDNEQQSSYAETEAFWEKIHQQSVDNGEKMGWDLWALDAGETQGFQYLTVQLYDDPAKMMEGSSWDDLIANAKKAYPNMSEEQIAEKIGHSSKTRDLAVRIYLRVIDVTEDDFVMAIGTVSRMNAMNVKPGQGAAYEKMEGEIFKPIHQRQVDAGQRGHWGLARQMSPYGTDVYATHYTFDMYTDFAQMFSSQGYDGPEITAEQQKQIQEGMATRDLRKSTIMKMIRKVRPSNAATAGN